MSKPDWLPVADADLGGAERDYLLQAFDSGWLSGSGEFVERFEHKFAEFIGVRHGIACSNGTVALHLALLALGVGPGDEVIVPSLTFVATANAVSHCGATPVFADCDPRHWNATADTIERLVSPSTKGIIVVHLFGNPVDMDPILAFSRERGIFVLEDAAEAHGATYRQRPIGSIADAATFSFYGNKIITTGEGGMITTDNAELAKQMRLLRGQGMDRNRRYWFATIGYNYRLTNLQSALGVAQLERVNEFVSTRKQLAKKYMCAFSECESISVQTELPWGESVWWMFGIVVKTPNVRAAVMSALAREGIETRPFFHAVHDLPPYRNRPAVCPNSELLGQCGISLPTGRHVTDTHIANIQEIVSRHCEAV